MEQSDMLVILKTGKQDRGMSATLALGWACTALAMNKSVTLYLTMDGTIWAIQGAAKNIQVDGFEPLSEYMENFIALGGKIIVCAPCTEYYCALPQEGDKEQLIPVAVVGGLSTVVGMVNNNSTVVSF